MAHHPGPPAARRVLVAASAVLACLLVLTGCGGSDGEKRAEKTPSQVLAGAKKQFDDASSVHIELATDSIPTSGNGVLGASGDITQDPAFGGEVKVVLDGLTASVPITSVGGQVYAKLPLQTRYAVIKPEEYGAPDPADFANPDTGLSSLLTSMENVKKGEKKRSGDTILTSYTGTLPGAKVKAVIPSADAEADYATVVGIDDQGRAITVKITGPFFSGSDDTTYDVTFSQYGQGVEITAPPA